MKYILFLFVFCSLASEAMVFDINKRKFGSYLRSTYSPWASSQAPFSQSSGNNVSFNNQFTNLMSYEFGFLFNAKRLNWRFGFELIQPAQISGMTGANVGGTALYTMNSAVTVYMPKVGVEVNLRSWTANRFWLFAEYGYATLNVENSYNFTATGTATFSLANFREVVKSTQSNYSAGLGFETLMSDSTTFSLELGYRMLYFTDITHNLATTNFQGAQAVGSKANQNNGTARDLNMTGPFASVLFRIYVY